MDEKNALYFKTCLKSLLRVEGTEKSVFLLTQLHEALSNSQFCLLCKTPSR